MNEYKVKYKLTGFVYIIRAYDQDHAKNKALQNSGLTAPKINDFTIIK